MAVAVSLFGTARAAIGGEWWPLPADKRGCLLAYLCYVDGWVDRDRIAFLFWPDSDERSARRNLRQLLQRVRQTPLGRTIEVEDARLALPAATDVREFRDRLAAQDWGRALEVVQPAFLEGLPRHGGVSFEAWHELEQESLVAAHRHALVQHARALQDRGAHAEAARLLEEHVQGDRLAEDVLEEYLRAAYLAGQRASALAAYDEFAARLRAEIGLEPSERTQALVADIRRSDGRRSPQRVLDRPRLPVALLRPPRMVGRDREVAVVLGAEEPFVALAGEPGAGKSRLLQELAPHAVAMTCSEALREVPYQPVAHVLQRLARTGMSFDDLGPYLDDLARLVPEVADRTAPPPSDPEVARSRLLEAAARALEVAAAEADAPYPLVVDDLQWADDATLELVTQVVRRGHVRVLGAYRSDEVGHALARCRDGLVREGRMIEVPVTPLAREELRGFLAELMGQGEGPPLFARWLFGATGGNPLFALETIKSLIASGILEVSDDGWKTALDGLTVDYRELEASPVVDGVVRRQLERLPGDARRVLEVVAAAGGPVAHDVLERATGLSEWTVLDAIGAAERAGFLVDDAFRHDVQREAVYRTVPAGRARAIHAKLAGALANTAEPGVVAEHWRRAGKVDAWLETAAEAARRMRRAGLHRDAADYLSRTLVQAEDASPALALALELGVTYREWGRPGDAEPWLQRVLEKTQEPRLRITALDALVGIRLQQGRIADAAAVLEQAERLMIRLDDPSLARALRAHSVQIDIHRGDYERALRRWSPVVEQLRASGRSVELATALTNIASTYDRLGRHDEALELHREAWEIACELRALPEQVNAALNLLYSCMDAGREAEGLPIAEEALALGRFEGTDTLRNNLAAAYRQLGRRAAAVSTYEALLEESSDPTLLAIAAANLAVLYGEQERVDDARAALDEALGYAEQTEFDVARARVCISAYAVAGDEAHPRVESLYDALDASALPGYMLDELRAARSAALSVAREADLPRRGLA